MYALSKKLHLGHIPLGTHFYFVMVLFNANIQHVELTQLKIYSPFLENALKINNRI